MAEIYNSQLNSAAAGNSVESKYSTLKNAFLSYRTADKKGESVASRIVKDGEVFLAGSKTVGKLGLADGCLRLFVDVRPSKANNYPHILNISTDRQLKYALELIDNAMRDHGYCKDSDYRNVETQSSFQRLQMAGAFGLAEDEQPENIQGARLPYHGVVVDESGEKLGKVRHRVWYDGERKPVGEFIKEEDGVLFYGDAQCRGYVDRNNNVLTFDNVYLGTVRYSRWWVIPLTVVILAFIMVFSSLVAGYYLTRTGRYAPVLFLADADRTEWTENKNLEVFFNETFGTSRIAPGFKGAYRFTFENRNEHPLEYNLAFDCDNPYGIGLVYRLKRDSAYISGTNGYVDTHTLSCSKLTIEAQSSQVFEIEWYWSDNDAVDTVAGENSAQYTLNIALTAWVDERR